MSIQTKDNHVLISKTMEKDPEGIIEVFEVASFNHCHIKFTEVKKCFKIFQETVIFFKKLQVCHLLMSELDIFHVALVLEAYSTEEIR